MDKLYIEKIIRPQFDYLGKAPMIMGVKYVQIFGTGIKMGDFATLITSPDAHIHLTTWISGGYEGKITIGDFCLISPGVRISAATKIEIGNSCMFANNAYVSDSDWHDIYDRAQPVGQSEPIKLEENVWVGDRAVICKGVTIGKNSIVGAGAIVTKDVPPNVIVAGNPAKIVKELDQTAKMKSREDMFSDPKEMDDLYLALDRYNLKGNTFFGWIKSKILPSSKN